MILIMSKLWLILESITISETPYKSGDIVQKTPLHQYEAKVFGATDPVRTGDLLITSELLYQLSHSSILADRTDSYIITKKKKSVKRKSKQVFISLVF